MLHDASRAPIGVHWRRSRKKLFQRTALRLMTYSVLQLCASGRRMVAPVGHRALLIGQTDKIRLTDK